MTIDNIIQTLECWAPPALQESYDNSGLLTGNRHWDCTSVLCTLDATEMIVEEAIQKGCNLIVAHHPIIFSGIKKWSGNSYVERTVIKAIKNDIAIYAIHTNLDNVQQGVNKMMAETMGLRMDSLSTLLPKAGGMVRLHAYVPHTHAEAVLQELYKAGAGQIGQYAECSFSTTGTGTFRPLAGSNPTIGTSGGDREQLSEIKIEVVLPHYLQTKVVKALHKAHPYETVAYGCITLNNPLPETGSGLIGTLPAAISETAFLHQIKERFGLSVIKYSCLLERPIRTVAICGGAGSFLLPTAIAAGADALVTSDLKYHEYFEADGRILFADIGHYESEYPAIAGIRKFLQAKFPTFAVLQTEVSTNPVHYLV